LQAVDGHEFSPARIAPHSPAYAAHTQTTQRYAALRSVRSPHANYAALRGATQSGLRSAAQAYTISTSPVANTELKALVQNTKKKSFKID